MPLKAYSTILKTGIYLSFVSVFLVFKNLLFPYITSKQIYFNILIEILAVFWLALIIKYPAYRPKKSYITYGLAAFFAALLASSIFGADFNLSFWGDIERMLGWFHVIHFFLFYLIIITVFRTKTDWRNLFIVSIAAAFLVSLISLFGAPFSTIGNTAYVSGYVIFNIFFALILLFGYYGEPNLKERGWFAGSLYLTAVFVMLLVMKQTNTRGAYVGLGVGLLLFLILSAAFSRSRRVKIFSLAAAVAAVALVVLVFKYAQSPFIRETPILRTIPQISSSAVTFQTRLISWKAAAKDFKNHIWLGTGYGNYAITFDKYFDPKFYDYTSSETYFDRAHNNLVDLASTAGSLGALTYFSIFAAVFYYLFKARKLKRITNAEFSLLVSLLAAYFIQNLAVFDSLVTYISLMLVLGYVYRLINGAEEESADEAGRKFSSNEIMALVMAGAVFLAVIYQYNVKVLMMLDGTIAGQMQFVQGNFTAGVEAYKKALSFKTPLDRDSRASLINVINMRTAALGRLDRGQAKAIAEYAVSLAEANVKLNPLDSMMQMQLAQSLNTAALAYEGDNAKFIFYSDRALAAIGESIKASPGRVTIYFTKAQIYLSRNDSARAIETLKYAFSLNQKYAETACYLAKVEIYYRQDAAGYADLDKCVDLGGAGSLDPLEFVKIGISHYEAKKNPARTLPLYQRWSELEPGNAKLLVNLSLLYAQKGDRAGAIKAAKKAGELDKTLKAAADEFIRKLGGE